MAPKILHSTGFNDRKTDPVGVANKNKRRLGLAGGRWGGLVHAPVAGPAHPGGAYTRQDRFS